MLRKLETCEPKVGLPQTGWMPAVHRVRVPLILFIFSCWNWTNSPIHSNIVRMSDEAMSNFTPRAQQVLALARKEADRLNHNFLGTEHLLLGLIKLGQGVAVNVLQKMGLDLETVRMEVEKQVG